MPAPVPGAADLRDAPAMERPTAATVACYDAAVPVDPRAVKGQMFGHPCSFVNGNMFFGTFHQTVVARIGSERAAELARGKLRIFEPMPGRAWKEYVQVDAGALPKAKLAALAAEALDWSEGLPPKKAKAGKAKTASTRVVAATKPAAKKSIAKKPAATKPAATKPAATKPAATKPAAKKR
jgi:hypothetical protein